MSASSGDGGRFADKNMRQFMVLEQVSMANEGHMLRRIFADGDPSSR